jgi:hypothetical protein
MDRSRNALLKAALAYAERGIPVTAGWPLEERSSTAWRRRRRLACGCGNSLCAAPGAHATGARRIVDPVVVRAVWTVPRTPNLMIASSPGIALWHVPQALGSYGMRILEQHRLPVWPAVTRYVGGGWLFGTQPPEDPSEVAIAPQQVRRLGEDEFVPVPPSRLPERRMFWLWAQRFPDTALPPARPVLAALATVAAERIAAYGGNTDDPARTAGRVTG